MSGMTGMIGDAFANQGGAGYNNPLNQLPIDMNGQVLTGLPPGVGMPTSDPREMDGTFNTPGQGMPGIGGKGGGGPLSQIPIDMQGNLLGMPQPTPSTPLGVEQGGTPGRPVPAAPMSPRGPGFANPGGPGIGVPGSSTPGAGGKGPASEVANAMQRQQQLQPMRPAVQQPIMPTAPIVSQRARVPRQAPQSMKGGMARGAGRGGLMR